MTIADHDQQGRPAAFADCDLRTFLCEGVGPRSRDRRSFRVQAAATSCCALTCGKPLRLNEPPVALALVSDWGNLPSLLTYADAQYSTHGLRPLWRCWSRQTLLTSCLCSSWGRCGASTRARSGEPGADARAGRPGPLQARRTGAGRTSPERRPGDRECRQYLSQSQGWPTGSIARRMRRVMHHQSSRHRPG